MTGADVSMGVPFVDLKAQYDDVGAEIRAAVDEVLRRSDFILGEAVGHFEEAMAAYCEVDNAVGVDSGTSALELALLALGVGPGDEVITAANTFIATALAISYTGATPVLVDVDASTYNLDPEQVADAITARTKAILPVHLFGQAAEMDGIVATADRHGIPVVEDASQAHGARYRGRRVGSLGHIAAFSLYPSKNLGALGDAGVVVTDDDTLAEQVRLLRNYGSKDKYHHVIRGFNRRLDTLQAAVLGVKLAHLDEWNKARRSHAGEYERLLGGPAGPVILPEAPPHLGHVYHAYVIRTSRRDELQAFLSQHGIATVIHYPIPIHLQPAYAHLGHGTGAFPNAERFAGEFLSLPMYPELTDPAIAYVCDRITAFFARSNPLHDRVGTPGVNGP